jgi:hypothetical protein
MVSGDSNTGCQSFDIPFPWSWEGFIEIVDIKYNMPFRGSKPSKIHEMAITTGLHANPGGRRAGQIVCHDRGGATIKSERRLYHTSVPDREKLFKAAFARLDQ